MFSVDYAGKGDMKVFTHIVAEIKNNDGIYEVHTKSNLSDRWDNWVLSEQDIVGRVERYFHGPFYYLQQNPNYFLLICIFSSVCFLVAGIVLLTVKEEKTNFKHIIKKYDYTENLLKKFKKRNIKNSIKK